MMLEYGGDSGFRTGNIMSQKRLINRCNSELVTLRWLRFWMISNGNSQGAQIGPMTDWWND